MAGGGHSLRRRGLPDARRPHVGPPPRIVVPREVIAAVMHPGAWKMRLPLSYVLPLRQDSACGLDELAGYVRWLADQVEVIGVDSSPPTSWRRHDAALGGAVRHLGVDPGLRFLNGKVS